MATPSSTTLTVELTVQLPEPSDGDPLAGLFADSGERERRRKLRSPDSSKSTQPRRSPLDADNRSPTTAAHSRTLQHFLDESAGEGLEDG